MFDQNRPPSHPRWKSGDAPVLSLARGAPVSPSSGKSQPKGLARPPGAPTSERPIVRIAERLIELWLANEHELAVLRKLRQRQRRARAYAAGRGASPMLVHALLQRIDEQIHQACARLGANDREARNVLAELGLRQVYWLDPANPGDQLVLQRRRFG